MQKNTSRQPRTKPVETHYKNTYFFHSPWQKCLPSQIKRPFPPSPFAMLFAITKEMHTWAVRPKQHCNRGGEGGEFVPFDTKIAWREIENCIEMSQQFCPGLIYKFYSRSIWPGNVILILFPESNISTLINYKQTYGCTFFHSDSCNCFFICLQCVRSIVRTVIYDQLAWPISACLLYYASYDLVIPSSISFVCSIRVILTLLTGWFEQWLIFIIVCCFRTKT